MDWAQNERNLLTPFRRCEGRAGNKIRSKIRLKIRLKIRSKIRSKIRCTNKLIISFRHDHVTRVKIQNLKENETFPV